MMSRPLVGVSVIVRNKEGLFLMGVRRGSHGEGTWSFPGGHLEYSESVEECGIRECLEEIGISLRKGDIIVGPYTNNIFLEENRHYITLYLVAETNKEPVNLEPQKCDGWHWFSWDDLPKPLFYPVVTLIESGFDPRESSEKEKKE
jgi:8-oxo-dGTP diphosphatase